MTRRAALFVLALMISPVVYAAQAAPQPVDVTGTWTGSFIMTVNNGEPRTDVAFLVLTQKGAVVTGTAGPSLEQQWPILDGKVEGTKVTFGAQSGGPSIKFVLTLVDGRLKGDATAEEGGVVMTAKADLGRTK